MSTTLQPTDLAELLVGPVRESHGIRMTRETDDPTMWDREAALDPVHAAVSAPDENAERAKSIGQINKICQHVSPSTVLLDLGCGYGRIAKYLLPRTRIGGYIGVDSSITMLRLFKDRYDGSPEERRTPALFVNSDIARLPVKDAAVDMVVVSAVFLHNHKRIVRQAMSEVHRVLKPGGKLLVFSSFPRQATLMGVQGAMYQTWLDRGSNPERNGPVRYYTRGEMRDLLAGFSRFELESTGFTFLPKSINGLYGLPERLFRRGFAEPLNRLAASVMPRRWLPAFAVHYDVVATK